MHTEAGGFRVQWRFGEIPVGRDALSLLGLTVSPVGREEEVHEEQEEGEEGGGGGGGQVNEGQWLSNKTE